MRLQSWRRTPLSLRENGVVSLTGTSVCDVWTKLTPPRQSHTTPIGNARYQDAMPNGLRSLESLSAIQCSPEREGCTEYSPSLQAIGSTASALATLPSLAIPAPGGLVAGVSLALIGGLA